MVDNVRRECIMSMYEIYPLSRKLVFDTFDKKKYDITRTQQIIMLSLCIEGTLTMSQLASKINTSNEQATRAVAQLVDKGFVIRMQNPDNRRVINIRLTDEAMRFMEKMKNEAIRFCRNSVKARSPKASTTLLRSAAWLTGHAGRVRA